LYPPILFASGFNLKKKAFIKNMNYITMFGVLGTFFFFIVVVFLLYWSNELSTYSVDV
jgi:NhaP-type Na+/H+ or K+/H+ antiporter